MADARLAFGALAVVSIIGVALTAPSSQSAQSYTQLPDFTPYAAPAQLGVVPVALPHLTLAKKPAAAALRRAIVPAVQATVVLGPVAQLAAKPATKPATKPAAPQHQILPPSHVSVPRVAVPNLPIPTTTAARAKTSRVFTATHRKTAHHKSSRSRRR